MALLTALQLVDDSLFVKYDAFGVTTCVKSWSCGVEIVAVKLICYEWAEYVKNALRDAKKTVISHIKVRTLKLRSLK